MHKGFWLQCKYSICSLCMQGCVLSVSIWICICICICICMQDDAQCVNLDNEMPRIELHRFDWWTIKPYLNS